jgi:hypothetical protein
MESYKEVINIFYDEFKPDIGFDRPPVTAKTITAMIIINEKHQINPWRPNTRFMNNKIYNIYNNSDNKMNNITSIIAESIRKVDSMRGNELPIITTSFFAIKLVGEKYKIPFSRSFEKISSGIMLPLYPRTLKLENVCKLNLQDIESIDMVVLSSLRAIKREFLYKEKAVTNFDGSSSDLFQEELV